MVGLRDGVLTGAFAGVFEAGLLPAFSVGLSGRLVVGLGLTGDVLTLFLDATGFAEAFTEGLPVALTGFAADALGF